MEYNYIETGLKLADAKEIFAALSHMLITGYIDSFGVVKGVSKNPAYLPIFTITNKAFIDLYGNKLFNFDDMYDLYKSIKNKASIAYGINDGKIISIKNTETNMEIPFVFTAENTCVEFHEYSGNPHLFKVTDKIDLNLDLFISSIVNDYIYQDGKYIITREAVPKPKKISYGWYSVSEIVDINVGSTNYESYIYFTTHLEYPLFTLKVANGCYNLD